MVFFATLFVACSTASPDDSSGGDSASDTANDTGLFEQPAAGHLSCAPDDAVVREFLVGTEVCDGPPLPPFARITPMATTFAVGDHFSIADGTLLAGWQTAPDAGSPAQTAELDVLRVDAGVEFTWTMVAEGTEHSGKAYAELCEGDEPQCG